MCVSLSPSEESALKSLHRSLKKKREADRVKTVLMLHKGLTQKQVSELLLLDENSVGKYKRCYLERQDETSWYKDNYKGYVGKLSYVEVACVLKYCSTFKVQGKAEVGEFIARNFGPAYSASGLQRLFSRTGLSFQQLHRLPGKADLSKQEAFVESFGRFKEGLSPGQTYLFADAAHPLHNSTAGRIWSPKGQQRWINSNTGRQRVNINGAYNPNNQDVIYRQDDRINTASTIGLLQQISEKYRQYECVYVFFDNARANKNKELALWLKSQSHIRVKYLPPYSPNLNLIERLWKLMRKKVMHTKFYPDFAGFEAAVLNFFETADQHKEEIKQFIGHKFQLFKPGSI